MSDLTVTHSSFVVERRLPASRQQVWRAFADPDLKQRWFAEGDQHDVEEFASDLQVGAGQRLRYRFRDGTPFAGLAISNVDTVLDLVPEQRIIEASRMAFSDNIISVALVTTELRDDGDGTHLSLTFQGAFLPGADGPQIREMGWNAMFDRLESVLGEDTAALG